MWTSFVFSSRFQEALQDESNSGRGSCVCAMLGPHFRPDGKFKDHGGVDREGTV